MKSHAHLLFVLPFISIVLILSLTPIISRDALIHHMALPKIWLSTGMFSIDAFRPYAFYPANIQLLYYLALACKFEFLPKIIHLSFLILTSTLIYNYLREKEFNPYFSLLAFVLTLTIPINQRLASEVYVDLALLFFSSLSIIYFLKWKNSLFLHTRYFYISAIGSGLAFGTKYNGLIPFIIINSFISYAYSRYSKNNIKVLFYSVTFFVITIALVSPWLIRNYVASGGNPFYPLFSSIFPDSLDVLPSLHDMAGSNLLYRASSGESLTDILLIPVRFFFQGEDNNFLKFDGKLNPMMLILLPFAFIPSKSKQTIKPEQSSDKAYLLLFFLLVLFLSLKGAIRIRYAIPIITPLIILNIYALYTVFSYKSRFMYIIGSIFIVVYIYNNLYYTYEIFNRLDVYRYMTLKESKQEYLRRKLHLYDMYEFINSNTNKNSIIYDVLCGHRSYYVDREYIHDQSHIDKGFFNPTSKHLGKSYYINYLGNIETRIGGRVTHLLIKPAMFIETYKNIFSDSNIIPKEIYQERLSYFIDFLKHQRLLFQSDGAVLYELVYDDRN